MPVLTPPSSRPSRGRTRPFSANQRRAPAIEASEDEAGLVVVVFMGGACRPRLPANMGVTRRPGVRLPGRPQGRTLLTVSASKFDTQREPAPAARPSGALSTAIGAPSGRPVFGWIRLRVLPYSFTTQT